MLATAVLFPMQTGVCAAVDLCADAIAVAGELWDIAVRYWRIKSDMSYAILLPAHWNYCIISAEPIERERMWR